MLVLNLPDNWFVFLARITVFIGSWCIFLWRRDQVCIILISTAIKAATNFVKYHFVATFSHLKLLSVLFC